MINVRLVDDPESKIVVLHGRSLWLQCSDVFKFYDRFSEYIYAAMSCNEGNRLACDSSSYITRRVRLVPTLSDEPDVKVVRGSNRDGLVVSNRGIYVRPSQGSSYYGKGDAIAHLNVPAYCLTTLRWVECPDDPHKFRAGLTELKR